MDQHLWTRGFGLLHGDVHVLQLSDCSQVLFFMACQNSSHHISSIAVVCVVH